MIADMVKGKQIEQFPERIQRGIHIHRKIDAFTDSHPVNQKALEYFRSSAGKYASPFLDVAYDHFLALDQLSIPEKGWHNFTEACYIQIGEYAEILPTRFCSMFVYMRSEDWLYNYRYQWLIKRSFNRLKQRASYLDNNAPVFEEFKKNYKEIGESYKVFFPELKMYVKDILCKS